MGNARIKSVVVNPCLSIIIKFLNYADTRDTRITFGHIMADEIQEIFHGLDSRITEVKEKNLIKHKR